MPPPADRQPPLGERGGSTGVSPAQSARADPCPPAPMSYEQFLDWADEDTHAEWVDGEVVMTSPANLRHHDLAQFLSAVLGGFLHVHDLGKLLVAPFQMKLPRSGREPDLLFVATDHLHRLRSTFLDGPADLAIEIVSPESEQRDRVTKRHEYAEGGVQSYLLLDPDRTEATLFERTADGNSAGPPRNTCSVGYPSAGPVPLAADGTLRFAALPGFWLRVEWLWQQPLPDPTRVLLRIDGQAYARYLEAQARLAGR